jgi:hypothetical protein
LRGYSQGSCGLQKSYRRADERTEIKCLSNGRKNLITLKGQTTKMYLLIKKNKKIPAIYLYQSLQLPEVSAQESVYKSFVYIYQWMSGQFFYTFLTKKSDYNLFGELRIAEILQTDGRTDGDQVFEQRA